MKTFKKISLLFFTIFCISLFSFSSNATEVTLDTQNETEDVSPIYGMDAIVRDCRKLNIRQEPSTSSNILCTISVGEHVTIIDQVGKWFEIKYQDISGFVFWKYISFTEPQITEESNLIASSIIHYTSSENRDYNISLACQTINGTIINPGEQFRWSSIVGNANQEKGYLTAPIIVNGRYVPDYGGGVCQVSTTIYNALLDTPIIPDELHHHGLPCAYAKNDATVAYGYKDFAFTNFYQLPMYIETYSYKSVVFVNFYLVYYQEVN